MAVSSMDDQATKFHGANSDHFSSVSDKTATDKSSGNTFFARRSVRTVLLVVGAIAFPITMCVVLISELCHSYNGTDIPRTVKIKRAVVAMMFTVPIIGPIVIRQLFNELIMYDKEIIPKDEIYDNDYFIACIPFVSTILIIDHMIHHFFDVDESAIV
ncbi:MAG: hypothetical protein KAG53_05140 [Endozoicomonadaceae bacterium]|nr:hypothetical protein [Endozoicomonadaceae bacterium]